LLRITRQPLYIGITNPESLHNPSKLAIEQKSTKITGYDPTLQITLENLEALEMLDTKIFKYL